MNTLTNILRYTTVAVLCIAMLSCGKDGEKDETFDINKLSEYILFARRDDGNPKTSIYLFDFKEGNKLVRYTSGSLISGIEATYTIEDNAILVNDGLYRVVVDENGNVTSMTYNRPPGSPEQTTQIFRQSTLIKKSATNQLAGKSFKGKHRRASDGSVVEIEGMDEFPYTFAANGKLEGGITIGNLDREEDYALVGNVAYLGTAARGNLTGRETLVLLNGKLEVSYYSREVDPDNVVTTSYLYGSFEEKK